jgi:hypothetical protein
MGAAAFRRFFRKTSNALVMTGVVLEAAPHYNTAMNKVVYHCVCAALSFAAALAVSCAASPGAAENGPPDENAAAGIPNAAALPENGLDSRAFKTIPAEAREYLERLARAFRTRDRQFLLDQGEKQFETEMRPGRDEESYLALLYRAGAYAVESPRLDSGLPRLNPAAINGIEYLSWEENGPLLEIMARLLTTDGANTPCRLMLAWRLPEPKIEGLFR